MLQEVVESCCLQPRDITITGNGSWSSSNSMIMGTLVLMKKNFLELHCIKASFLDRIHKLLGKGVSSHLMSSVHPAPEWMEGQDWENSLLDEAIIIVNSTSRR
ncbi:unnamed protein product [Linum trigynum]|uniref:Uncharacterized protein n=1 Tax=Linum trigynum TaxID=586398 RepID=A0AAV2ELV2_9ROSI